MQQAQNGGSDDSSSALQVAAYSLAIFLVAPQARRRSMKGGYIWVKMLMR